MAVLTKVNLCVVKVVLILTSNSEVIEGLLISKDGLSKGVHDELDRADWDRSELLHVLGAGETWDERLDQKDCSKLVGDELAIVSTRGLHRVGEAVEDAGDHIEPLLERQHLQLLKLGVVDEFGGVAITTSVGVAKRGDISRHFQGLVL